MEDRFQNVRYSLFVDKKKENLPFYPSKKFIIAINGCQMIIY